MSLVKINIIMLCIKHIMPTKNLKTLAITKTYVFIYINGNSYVWMYELLSAHLWY